MQVMILPNLIIIFIIMAIIPLNFHLSFQIENTDEKKAFTTLLQSSRLDEVLGMTRLGKQQYLAAEIASMHREYKDIDHSREGKDCKSITDYKEEESTK